MIGVVFEGDAAEEEGDDSCEECEKEGEGEGRGNVPDMVRALEKK